MRCVSLQFVKGERETAPACYKVELKCCGKELIESPFPFLSLIDQGSVWVESIECPQVNQCFSLNCVGTVSLKVSDEQMLSGSESNLRHHKRASLASKQLNKWHVADCVCVMSH